ncbi:MAG TPA: plastocyanin/azurin family copper-binding protein [Gemmatimonadaceae bacterium]|jgi:plastocyanin|nr:plastocyanin/azurin family copper-binding protein [Gemmatimonadaceae bacterium]
MNRKWLMMAALGAGSMMAACGGGEKPQAAESTAAAPAAAAPAAGGTQTPEPGGKVITVELITDGTGNYFKPNEIEAHPGDVIRYTLKVGVHNVHFLPDSNPGATGLPPASDFLQLPGQTYDLKVTFKPGTYYFQCDPHAALGMHGHLKVEPKS